MKRSPLLVLILIAPLILQATELAVDWYRQEQQKAPEYLSIKVAKNEFENTDTNNSYLITSLAKVVEVFRTGSDLVPGTIISIRYIHRFSAGEDECFPPVLEIGKSYPPFLSKNKDEVIYELAVECYSFAKL